MADRNCGWNTGKNDFIYVGYITKRKKFRKWIYFSNKQRYNV